MPIAASVPMMNEKNHPVYWLFFLAAKLLKISGEIVKFSGEIESRANAYLPVHDEGAYVGCNEGVHPGASPSQVACWWGQRTTHWAEHHARQVNDHNSEGREN